jgi:hypothetical protein
VCGKCGRKGHMSATCRIHPPVAAPAQGDRNKVELSNVFANKIPKPPARK